LLAAAVRPCTGSVRSVQPKSAKLSCTSIRASDYKYRLIAT
jgi:hypothetical protein